MHSYQTNKQIWAMASEREIKSHPGYCSNTVANAMREKGIKPRKLKFRHTATK